MLDTRARQTINEAIEAHGGMAYWQSLMALKAEISASGFLFAAKQRPVLRRLRMRAATRAPRFSFLDFPKPRQTSELLGPNEARIIDDQGKVHARRENPRAAFHGPRKLFSWDDLDFIYFGGDATWNYLTAPFLLAQEGLSRLCRGSLTI